MEALEEGGVVEEERVGVRRHGDVDGGRDGVLVVFVGFADVDEEARGGGGFEDFDQLVVERGGWWLVSVSIQREIKLKR